MKANVKIYLEVIPEKKHFEYIKKSASCITNNINDISLEKTEGKIIKINFPVQKKSQSQLAEEIRKSFSYGLEDYGSISVSFEK